MEKADYSQLNGRLLKVFLSVFEEGSINRAAVELELNQSTVSYSIDKLRELFDDALFVKSGRGIAPTDRARAIAPRIRQLVDNMDEILSEHDYHPANDTEKIVVATHIAGVRPVCNFLYREFQKRSPSAPVQFTKIESRKDVAHIVDHQLADIVLSIRPAEIPSFMNSAHLKSIPWRCYYDPAQRGAVSSMEEFLQAEHAALDLGISGKGILGHVLEALAQDIKIKLYVPDVLTLQDTMVGTKLVTTIPEYFMRDGNSKLASCVTPLPIPPAQFEMFWHRRAEHSPRNKWIRTVAFEAFQKVDWND